MSERTENPNWPTPEQVQSALTWARMFGHTETGWAAKILAKEQARLRAEQSLPARQVAAEWLTAEQRTCLENAIEHARFHYWHSQADAIAAALSTIDSLTAQLAAAREENERLRADGREFICKARPYNDPPIECDFPFCGCSRVADEAVESVIECGWLNEREAANLQSQLTAAREECERLRKYDAELTRCEAALEKWPLASGCNGHLQVAGHVENVLAELTAAQQREAKALDAAVELAKRVNAAESSLTAAQQRVGEMEEELNQKGKADD